VGTGVEVDGAVFVGVSVGGWVRVGLEPGVRVGVGGMVGSGEGVWVAIRTTGDPVAVWSAEGVLPFPLQDVLARMKKYKARINFSLN